MSEFTASRRVLTHRHSVAATPRDVFPLLCPVREYDWIEEWKCRLIHTESGVAETGCVFVTTSPVTGGDEVWVVDRYHPPVLISFVKVAPGYFTTRFEVRLTEGADGATIVDWTQTIVGLTEDGNAAMKHITPAAYTEKIEGLAARLAHYLDTGTMLTAA